jgi:16S rRNA (cytosine967-C5)-methyltransferase
VTHPSIPLWRQLQTTAQVLLDVRNGRSLTQVLDRVDRTLRPGVQSLAFHVMRVQGRAQALRRALARRAPPPSVDALLVTALALVADPQAAPYEAFTLVDQAVEAAKRDAALRPSASFVNACLRRFLRERDRLMAETDADPVARWNHPAWWIKRLKADHPSHWEAILEANNAQAPMALRVNVGRVSPAHYLQMLEAAGIAAVRQGAAAILLDRALPVQDIPGFTDGLVSVQDAGAQLAAPLLLQGLASQGAPNVLDACAAPGGKTAHLLEAGNGRVTALDIDPQRCERIEANLQRLGLRAKVLAADAGDPASWWDGQPFDAILLDAPCTASGIVRRHPDVRWLRRESDIAQLATVQARLLSTLWPLLRPGGRLLYCTCSVFRAEGSQQIKAFVANNTNAAHLASPGHLMPHFRAVGSAVPDNCTGDHDGFFYALLEKRPA